MVYAKHASFARKKLIIKISETTNKKYQTPSFKNIEISIYNQMNITFNSSYEINSAINILLKSIMAEEEVNNIEQV